jgi:hypothetical protein
VALETGLKRTIDYFEQVLTEQGKGALAPA